MALSTLWMTVLINLLLIGCAFAQGGSLTLDSDGTTTLLSASGATVTLTYTPGDTDTFSPDESPAAYLFAGKITQPANDVSQDGNYISMTTTTGVTMPSGDQVASAEPNYGVVFKSALVQTGQSNTTSYTTTIQIGGEDSIAVGGYYTVIIPAPNSATGSKTNYVANFLVSPTVQSISLGEENTDGYNINIPLSTFGGQKIALMSLLSGGDIFTDIKNPFPVLNITTSKVQGSSGQDETLTFNYGESDSSNTYNYSAIADAGITFGTNGSNIFTVDTTAGGPPELNFSKNTGSQDLTISVNSSSTSSTRDSSPQSETINISTFSTTPDLTGIVEYVNKQGAKIPGTVPAFDFGVNMTVSGGSDTSVEGFPSTVQNDGDGSISFLPENFTFQQAGTYTVTITESSNEQNNNNKNITYNVGNLTYTVTYTVTALTNGSGFGFTDSDVTVSWGDNTSTTYNPGDNQIVFKNQNNTYTSPASLTISGSKTLLNTQTNTNIPTTGYTFSFTIAAQSTNNCPMPANTTVELNTNTGTFSFAPIQFNTAGTYVYQISEQQGKESNITYDPSVFVVTVTVTDNNGTLTATQQSITKNGQTVDQIAFVNKYAPAANTYVPVSVEISGTVSLSQSTIYNGQFSFTLIPVSVSQSTGYVQPPINTDRTATNNGAGVFTFAPISLDKPGIYVYKVIQNTSVNANTAGVTFDTTVYTVVVELTSNSNGTLSSTYIVFKDTQTEQNTQVYSGSTLSSNAVAYKNTYNSTATNTLVINGYKELTYDPTNASPQASKPAAGQFMFKMVQQGTTANSWEATNNANGTFAFPVLRFSSSGTNTYTVSEVNSSTGGYKTDSSVYTVTVECSSGGTITSVSFSKNGDTAQNIIFNNTTTLQPPALSATITPSISGGQGGTNLLGATVNYTVTVSNSAQSQLAKNVSISVDIPYGLSITSISNNGNFVPTYNNSYNTLSSQSLENDLLSPLATSGAGPGQIVWPTISELGSTPVTYTFTAQVTNASAYTTPVKLLATADNIPITATTVVNGRDVGISANAVLTQYSNSYVIGGTVNIVPNTVTPPSGTFTFNLTTLNNAPLPSSTTTINTGSTFEFSPIMFNSPGVYEYSVTQTKGTNNLYTYDTSVYYITLTVTSTGTANTYSITPTIRKQAAGSTTSQVVNAITFTNEYLGGPSTGTNPYLTVTKTQALNFSPSATTSSLTYQSGDKITYFINVTNDGNETITDVQVVDTIPTGIVASSATVYNGGTLSNRVITWNVGDIDKGETETVSFSVTVPSGVNNITNVAQANCYEDPTMESSNEVTASLSTAPTATVSLVKTQKLGDGSFTEMPLIAQENQNVTYQITAVNNTSENLQNLIIQDTIPSGLSLVNGSITNNGKLENGNVVTWSIANLPAGQNASVQFMVTIPTGLTNVPYRNVATLNYSGSSSFVSSNTVAINAPTSGGGSNSGTGTPTKVITKTVTTTTTTTTTANPKTGVNMTIGNWILLCAMSVALYLMIKQRMRTEYRLFKD